MASSVDSEKIITSVDDAVKKETALLPSINSDDGMNGDPMKRSVVLLTSTTEDNGIKDDLVKKNTVSLSSRIHETKTNDEEGKNEDSEKIITSVDDAVKKETALLPSISSDDGMNGDPMKRSVVLLTSTTEDNGIKDDLVKKNTVSLSSRIHETKTKDEEGKNEDSEKIITSVDDAVKKETALLPSISNDDGMNGDPMKSVVLLTSTTEDNGIKDDLVKKNTVSLSSRIHETKTKDEEGKNEDSEKIITSVDAAVKKETVLLRTTCNDDGMNDDPMKRSVALLTSTTEDNGIKDDLVKKITVSLSSRIHENKTKDEEGKCEAEDSVNARFSQDVIGILKKSSIADDPLYISQLVDDIKMVENRAEEAMAMEGEKGSKQELVETVYVGELVETQFNVSKEEALRMVETDNIGELMATCYHMNKQEETVPCTREDKIVEDVEGENVLAIAMVETGCAGESQSDIDKQVDPVTYAREDRSEKEMEVEKALSQPVVETELEESIATQFDNKKQAKLVIGTTQEDIGNKQNVGTSVPHLIETEYVGELMDTQIDIHKQNNFSTLTREEIQNFQPVETSDVRSLQGVSASNSSIMLQESVDESEEDFNLIAANSMIDKELSGETEIRKDMERMQTNEASGIILNAAEEEDTHLIDTKSLTDQEKSGETEHDEFVQAKNVVQTLKSASLSTGDVSIENIITNTNNDAIMEIKATTMQDEIQQNLTGDKSGLRIDEHPLRKFELENDTLCCNSKQLEEIEFHKEKVPSPSEFNKEGMEVHMHELSISESGNVAEGPDAKGLVSHDESASLSTRLSTLKSASLSTGDVSIENTVTNTNNDAIMEIKATTMREEIQQNLTVDNSGIRIDEHPLRKFELENDTLCCNSKQLEEIEFHKEKAASPSEFNKEGMDVHMHELSISESGNVVESPNAKGLVSHKVNVDMCASREESLSHNVAEMISNEGSHKGSEIISNESTIDNHPLEKEETKAEANQYAIESKERFEHNVDEETAHEQLSMEAQELDNSVRGVAESYNENKDFEIGDLVWAKVRSHPWWPAQIFDPEDASNSAMKSRKTGKFLVAFFGDCTFAWLQESEMMAFQSHFKARAKKTMKSFRKAVDEALEEVCQRSELGLVCKLKNYNGMLYSRSTFLDEKAGIQKGTRIKKYRDVLSSVNKFQPDRTLKFLKDLACSPFDAWNCTLDMSELRGHAYGLRAYRVASKHKIDENKVEDSLSTHGKRIFSSLDFAADECKEAKKLQHKDREATPGRRKQVVQNKTDDAETSSDVESGYLVGDCVGFGEDKNSSALEEYKDKKGLKRMNLEVSTKKRRNKDENSVALLEIVKCKKKLKHTKRPASLGEFEVAKESDFMEIKENDGTEKLFKAAKSTQEANCNVANTATKGDSKSKSNKYLKFGDSMRKVASELTGALPLGKCLEKSNKRMQSIPKKRTSFKTLADDLSLSQLYEGLSLSAMDPLNYSGMNCHEDKIIQSLLKFRNIVFKKSNGYSKDAIAVSDGKTGKVIKRSKQGHKADVKVMSIKKAARDAVLYKSPRSSVRELALKVCKRKSEIVQNDVEKKGRRNLKLASHNEHDFESDLSEENPIEPFKRFENSMIKYTRRLAAPSTCESNISSVQLYDKKAFPEKNGMPSSSEEKDAKSELMSLASKEPKGDSSSSKHVSSSQDNINQEKGINNDDDGGNIQDQMMTLLRKVSVIVGTPPLSSDTT